MANAIGTDWPKLYRALPFVPERIDSQRDEDVTKMYTTQKRLANHSGVTDCLWCHLVKGALLFCATHTHIFVITFHPFLQIKHSP